jgi:hypothetical protein
VQGGDLSVAWVGLVSESLVSSDPSTGDALFGGNTSTIARCLYCFPGPAGREIVWRLKFTRAEVSASAWMVYRKHALLMSVCG